MTPTEKHEHLETLSQAMLEALHAAGVSNAEAVEVIALLLCHEALRAGKACGDPGIEAVFVRLFRICSQTIPSVAFHLVRRR